MKSKWTVLTLIVIIFSLTAGCWDRREIESIGMTIGMALDKTEDASEIKMTQQFVNTIIGQKKQTVKSYYNIATQGRNIFDMIRESSIRTDRSPFYTHLKIILISDEIASSVSLTDLMNLFNRDHEFRRTVQILFIEGKAEKALEMETRNREIPSLAIWGMTQNDYKTSEIPRVVTLGDMSIHLSGRESFMAQYVRLDNNGIRIKGAALISGESKKLIGWLTAEETKGINLLLGTQTGSRGGTLTVKDGSNKDIVYEIKKVRTRIEPIVEGERISFKVRIKSEGHLGENRSNQYEFDRKILEKMNRLVAKEIKRLVLKGLAKTKTKYKADIAGFGQRLKIRNYNTWKQVKEDWNEIFGNAEIDVDVKVITREFGAKGRKVPKT